MYRVVTIWVCCLLALGSCTKPQQGGTLPPLPSASPTPSASPSKLVLPAEPVAAIAALGKAYFLESNQAIRSGSTAGLRQLSTPACQCVEFADRIDQDWRKGRVDSPNYYTVVDLRSPMLDSATGGHVTVFYRTNRYRVVDSSGKVLIDVRAEPKTLSSSVYARRDGAGWKVIDVQRLG